MRLKILGKCAVLVCFALMGSKAWADNITVQNASFEITNTLNSPCGTGCAYNLGPIPDWTSVSGQSGSWQPNSSYYNFPLPNGNTVAFTNPGVISQDLGVALAPYTDYTLSVFVGHRLDGQVGNYTISLDAGSTIMCSFTGLSTAIPIGTFAKETCSFDTGASVPLGDLTVLLGNTNGQANFDDVVVTTPEPGAILLLSVGLAVLLLYAAFSTRKQGFQASVS